MRKKIMCSRKIFFRIVTLAFILVGSIFWKNDSSNVLAAQNQDVFVKQYQIDEYRKDFTNNTKMGGLNRTYSKYPVLSKEDVSDYQDWIFAGWFSNEACTNAISLYETTGTYYARFVRSDILSIRCQIGEDVTKDTEKTNLRLVSSTDDADYRDVGFVVQRKTKIATYAMQSVYKRINASSENGNDVAYSPQALHKDSEYFFTFNLTNIGKANYSVPFYLCPFWRTMDGTMVCGEERYACVEDGYLHIVNVPVRLNTDMMAIGGRFTVDYSCDGTDFKYIGYQTIEEDQKEIFKDIVQDNNSESKKVTITANSSEAVKTEGLVANLRFQLNQGTILSETTFKITEEKFNINGQETTLDISDFVFRNFPTKYSGGYDITWYDDPEEDTFGIASAADLYGLAHMVNEEKVDFTGKTVYVVADIKVNEGTVSEWLPNNPHNWTSIGEEKNATVFNGIFDGQGHTISGIYLNTADTSVGLFGQSTGTLKDFRLTDSKIISTYASTSAVCVGSVVGYCYGEGEIDSVYSNAEIDCGIGYECGGLVGRYGSVDDSTTIAKTISNCCFDGVINSSGRRVGGIVGRVYAGKKVIENCLNTGTINNNCSFSEYPIVAGLVGTVTVDNALDKTILDLKDSINAGIISASNPNGEVKGGVSAIVAWVEGKKDANNAYIRETAVLNMDNVYMLHESYSNAGAINDGTINGIIYRLQDEYLTDKNAVSWTLLDFESDWAARADKMPMPKALVSEKEQLNVTGISQPDITWHNTEETNYDIKNAADLCGLALLSTYYNFSGKTVHVTQDIEMIENVHWLPIGRIVSFAGTFGGASDDKIPTISGINLTTAKTNVGLFGNTTGGSLIRNIRLTNSDFESRYPNEGAAYVGSIVGFCAGDIDTVYSNATITSGAGYDCGGLVGRYGSSSTDKSIKNSWFDGSIVSEGRRIGGIVGNVHLGTKTVENCLNTGTITSTYEKANAEGAIIPFVAGLVGTVSNDGAVEDGITTLNLKYSVNSGKVIAEKASTGASSIVSRVVGEETFSGSGVYDIQSAVLNLKNVFMLDDTHNRDISIKSDGTITGLTMILNNRYISGKNAVAWTTLDFVNDWAARADKVPAPKAFVTDALTVTGIKQPDITWYDENNTSYGITNSQQLSGFALISTNCEFYDYKTDLPKEVKVANDIAWEMDADIPWLPIGRRLPFKGTFDGEYAEGKAAIISGIHITTDMQYVGLFGRCSEGSTIQNIGLKDSTFVSTYKGNIDGGDDDVVYMGSIAGYSLADLNNVYSNAKVTGYAMDIGGLVGRVNNTVNAEVGADETLTTSKLTTRIFENCWFDGIVTSDEQRVGGFVGELTQGSMQMTNCLFTGTINSTFKDIAVTDPSTGEVIEKESRIQTRAGGLCGFLQNQHTKLTVTDCIVTGEIKDSNQRHGVGAVFGRSTPNEGFTFDDVYITPGATYGTIETYIEDENGVRIPTETTVTGTADEVQDCDRLVGYIDYLNGDGLDFSSTWVIRKTGVPALKMFVPSEEIYQFTNLDEKISLRWWSSKLRFNNLVDMGVSNYVYTYSDTNVTSETHLSYYNTYIETYLKGSNGFRLVYDNSADQTSLKQYGVYTSVLERTDNGINWLVTVTHANKKKETYVSVTTGKTAAEALSPHMLNTTPVSYTATDGYTTSNQPIKLHMRETWFTGSSFVIQLPNGHFIINDGGSKHEFKYLIEDLYKWTGGDIEAGTNKPIIEAWTISHLHYAQSNVLSEFFSNPEYADKIYVEAVYLNEPSHDAMDLETDAETGLNDIYSCVRDEREGVKLLKTTKGEQTKIYRYQTGQRFYFDGVTMDVVLAQEQIPLSAYSKFTEEDSNSTLPELHGKFNTTSTGLMFTIDDGTAGGKKVYIGGDQTKVNMDWIRESYDAALFNDVNVFVTLNRGTNGDAEFATWCATKADGTHAFDYLLSSEQRAAMNTQSDCFRGEGTRVYTYNTGTVTLTFNSDGTITPTTEGARTEEQWTEHVGQTRPNQE